jgi:hypothetical protein
MPGDLQGRRRTRLSARQSARGGDHYGASSAIAASISGWTAKVADPGAAFGPWRDFHARQNVTGRRSRKTMVCRPSKVIASSSPHAPSGSALDCELT